MGEIQIRPATNKDLDELVRVENESWPEELAFTREHFEAHIELFKDFPEGLQVAVVNGKIAGIGIAEILDYDISNPIPSWYEATDEGFLRKTHNLNGNTLYGVSLSSSPRFSTLRIGRKIIEAAKGVTIKYHLEKFVLGSRVPRFYRYAKDMVVEKYVQAKRRGRFLDPELEFYSTCGLRIVKILPEYFDDPQSLNYGVLVAWDNDTV